jgi:metallo-beta-lactamase class B
MKVMLIILSFCACALPGYTAEIRVSEDIVLEPLSENVFVCISSINHPLYGKISANELLIREKNHAVIVNTPWNDAQSEKIYLWTVAGWKMKIDTVIVTHFHEDTLGGLGYFHAKGATSWSLEETRLICIEKKLPVPRKTFRLRAALDFDPVKLELLFPGEAHTRDNICVFLPDSRILFAGCMVKSANAPDLGNIEDANLSAWPATLRKLKSEYGSASVVVPGHGAYGDISLVDHTLSLFVKGK